jgi:tryptophanyl-tRNA synthetase
LKEFQVRVLSGIQPSGELTLGNYFGMMERMISYQEENELLAFIVNYHALTTVSDGELLRQNTINAAIDFLSLGLSPEKSVLWVQSDIPEVHEFTWYLSVFTPMGLLERCHSYKDKVAKGKAPNHGLFAYPVLMASDILMFGADKVPVGKDQKQHVEVTRDIAIKFNAAHGDILTIPEPDIAIDSAVVPGLDGQKMSKSYGNTISIFEPSKKVLRQKVMKIVTDTTPLEEPKDYENCSVFSLYKLFASDSQIETMKKNYSSGGYGYGHAKLELFELIWDHFAEARERREELAKDRAAILKLLADGAEKARAIAMPILTKVREAVGTDYR